MKRIIFTIIAVIALFGAAANAENVGDKIGEAVYSDLSVYINHYPIPAYVVNDYAVIIAEDLVNYCCDVDWDGNTRTLSITKSDEKTSFNVPEIYKTSMPVGTKYSDVLYTDIQAHVNGNSVTSFNINGRTMIVIDEFGNYTDGYTWVPELRAAKAWLDGKHITEYRPLSQRTVNLFNLYDYDYTEHFYNSADFDFDGKAEKIAIDISSPTEDTWMDQKMRITIGDSVRTVDTIGAWIAAVYVCDIDASDGCKDIAIITDEGSADPVLRIFRYDDYLTQYQFQGYDYYEDRVSAIDELWTGYIDSCYFNANDDGSITVECQTPSMGMWNVYKTFYRDDYGVFVEAKPEYYEILPDFMQNALEYMDIYGKERTMWQQGYIKAYIKFSSNGLTINKGDYFKVLYDDGNDYVYAVKENGKAGWIYIGWTDTNWEDRYNLNQHYFYMAG